MRILVVEDERKIAAVLTEALQAEHYDVVVSGNGEEGFFRASAEVFDLVVLDVMLPGRSGFEILRALRERQIHTPVLMLTARDGVDDRVVGLDLGADDYLVKPFAAEELLARVRALHRRGKEPAELLAYGDVVLDVSSRRARRGSRALELSAREADLLELMLRNPEQVVTRELALARVWEGGSATPNAVDRYVSYLRRKLGDPPLIQTVRGVGFVLAR